MQEQCNAKEAKLVAMRYLSYRDRSTREVIKRLSEKGFPNDVTMETVSYLTKLNYLNDARFASDLADSMARNKHWGKIKIIQKLIEKGINREIVTNVEKGFDETWEFSSAKKLLENWTRKHNVSDKDSAYKKKASAYRHLINKGFTPQVILEAIESIGI